MAQVVVMKGNGQYLLIAVIVSLGGFLFGFDASVISGVNRFVTTEFNLTELQLGWVVSSPTFSAMFAMLVAGPISDVIGRRKVLIVIAILYAVSALFSAAATSLVMLFLARMLGGIAFGGALILAPLYIAEIAPADKRGRLVSIQQLNIVLGFSAAYFCNYYFLNAIGEDSGRITEANVWRWMLGIELIPALIYFACLFFVPQSPRWLYLKKRIGAMAMVLARLHGPEGAQKEYEMIRESAELGSKQKKSKLKEVFKPALRFVLLIGLTVGILQQITGVNAIFFYAPTIFEQSGIGTNAAFTQAVWVGIINVIFTIVAMLLIDRLGRRPLLLIGIAGIAVSMFIAAYGFHNATYTLTEDRIESLDDELISTQIRPLLGQTFENDISFKAAIREAVGVETFSRNESQIIQAAIEMNPILILIGILGFVASFAISLGPVMWVMLSELFPNWVRGVMISLIGFVNSFMSWIVQFVFPIELATLGNAMTLLIFGLLAAIGFFIFLQILPETKGLSLEEIEEKFVRT